MKFLILFFLLLSLNIFGQPPVLHIKNAYIKTEDFGPWKNMETDSLGFLTALGIYLGNNYNYEIVTDYTEIDKKTIPNLEASWEVTKDSILSNIKVFSNKKNTHLVNIYIYEETKTYLFIIQN